MANTGYKIFTTRKQVLLDPATSLPGTIETGNTESNTAGTNYIAKELNTTSCPLGTSFNQSYIPTSTTKSAACSDQSSNTYYHNGSGTHPTNGDYVYTNAALTTPFNGSGKWFKCYSSPTSAYIVSSVGYVSGKQDC